MDAISECEQISNSKGRRSGDSPWRLYFRKEIFSPWHDPGYDHVSTELIYWQIARGVRNEEYKIEDVSVGHDDMVQAPQTTQDAGSHCFNAGSAMLVIY